MRSSNNGVKAHFQKSEPLNGVLLLDKLDKAINVLQHIHPNRFKINGKLIMLPPEMNVLVLGDLHGDIDTLKEILKLTHFIKRVNEKEELILICLGDYIDRGPNQVELMQFLLSLLVCYPSNVLLLRGNHEGPKDIGPVPHDFPNQLQLKFQDNWEKIYSKFTQFFDELYTACIIEEKILLLHGGIPIDVDNVDEIAWAHKMHPKNSTFREILWNDPSRFPGSQPSSRGMGMLFGGDVTREFIKKIDVKMIIRGHQPFNAGYHFHGDNVLTLFSCRLPAFKNRHAAYLYLPKNKCYNKNFVSKNITQV